MRHSIASNWGAVEPISVAPLAAMLAQERRALSAALADLGAWERRAAGFHDPVAEAGAWIWPTLHAIADVAEDSRKDNALRRVKELGIALYLL
jgi:hypothetical protein